MAISAQGTVSVGVPSRCLMDGAALSPTAAMTTTSISGRSDHSDRQAMANSVVATLELMPAYTATCHSIGVAAARRAVPVMTAAMRANFHMGSHVPSGAVYSRRRTNMAARSTANQPPPMKWAFWGTRLASQWARSPYWRKDRRRVRARAEAAEAKEIREAASRGAAAPATMVTTKDGPA